LKNTGKTIKQIKGEIINHIKWFTYVDAVNKWFAENQDKEILKVDFMESNSFRTRIGVWYRNSDPKQTQIIKDLLEIVAFDESYIKSMPEHCQEKCAEAKKYIGL